MLAIYNSEIELEKTLAVYRITGKVLYNNEFYKSAKRISKTSLELSRKQISVNLATLLWIICLGLSLLITVVFDQYTGSLIVAIVVTGWFIEKTK